MSDLVKIKGLKGKQNKKKWRKNIDVSALLQNVQKQHTQQLRQKYSTPLIVESENDHIRRPLDPNRFKSKGTPIPKPKYNNKIIKKNLIGQDIQDPWQAQKPQIVKYKKPQIPAIIKPQSGHSYNPDSQAIKKVIDTIIDYQADKPKKTKKIKKPQFRQQQVRHRNKNVRNQQLQLRQRRANKQLSHQMNSHLKISKQLQNKMQQIQKKINQKKQKNQKLEKQAATGKVRYGKRIGKLQYRYKEVLPNPEEIGKKLSHVGGAEEFIKDRFESVYRRGIFESRNIKVHANRTKHIKSKTKFRDNQ